MTFNPKLHPHAPRGSKIGGQFIHPGGWLEHLTDSSGARVGDGPHWARAKDRVKPRWQIPAERIKEKVDASIADDPSAEQDFGLDEIYKVQGYHAKPGVASERELDSLIEDHGWIELHRGFGVTHDGSAQRHVEQFRSGDRHYPGTGIRGNGTYTSTDADEVTEYTEPIDPPIPWHEMTDDQVVEWDLRTMSDPTVWPGRLRMALSPHARVAVYDAAGMFSVSPGDGDLGDFYREFTADRLTAWEDSTARGELVNDIGRYAALRGYDAIRIPGGLGDNAESDHYIILNRGALVVQEARK